MNNYDIAININLYANTEKEAEETIRGIINIEMNKPALQRRIIKWEFMEFISNEQANLLGI